MAVRITCPHCDAAFRVDESMRGKKVRCRECDGVLVVKAESSSSDAETTQTSAAKKKSPPAPRRDEEGERPTRQKKQTSKKSNSVSPVIFVVGGAALLVVAVIVVAVILMLRGEDNPPASTSTANSSKPSSAIPPAVEPAAMMKTTSAKPKGPSKQESAGGEAEKPSLESAAKDSASASFVRTGGQRIYPYVLKSTVWIVVAQIDGMSSWGSGSLIDRENRLVLTNYHVVRKGKEFTVFFPEYKNGVLVAERTFYTKTKPQDAIRGKVLGQNQRCDLALVQLNRLPADVDALPVASASVVPGETVHSVGNPGGSGSLWIYTSGTVRQVYHKKWQATDGHAIFDLEAQIVETQSPTNPGDSGGPLINDAGELVGVTQGGSRMSQLLSTFIDRSEVVRFVEAEAKYRRMRWVRSTRAPLSIISGAEGQVVELIQKLNDPDVKKRAQAVQTLGSLGSAARIAVPDLIQRLKDDDDFVRRLSGEALAKIGPPAKTDVSVLIRTLEDANSDVRLQGLEALGQLGVDAEAATTTLVKMVSSDDARVRAAAARALGKIGAADHDATVPVLFRALKDHHKTVRVAAAETLATFSSLVKSDVPLLLDALKSTDAEVRAAAAQGLGKMGSGAGADVIRPLLDLLQDGEKTARRAAIDALIELGPDHRQTLPLYIKALRDGDPEVRRKAIDALGKVGPEAATAVPKLAAALTDMDVRKNAIFALGKIGPAAAKEGGPALANFLTDKEVRLDAMDALAAIEPTGPEAKQIIPKLLTVFEEKYDQDVRTKAAVVFGKIGKPAVLSLVRVLQNEANSHMRLGAASSLAEIGPPARTAEAIAVLGIHAQADEDKEVRDECSKALTRIQVR